VELISGNFTTKGNVIFNQSLTVQSSSVTVSGDATFTQSVLVGNDAASAFITIGGQLTVPNNALVVDGITLSLAQDHTFESIHIKSGCVLTTPVATEIFKNGIAIEATTIIVDEGSRIDVSGKGFLGDSSAGRYTGGSHGGRGGYYESQLSGPVYGEYQTPSDVGYGGRNSSTNGTGSIRGGGAIKLTADELIVEGSILANGSDVGPNTSHGAGAGGSIWLDVGALSSVSGGEIQANGGRPYGSYIGGGGGGGRIAIYYEVLEFEQNNIVALGGLRGSTSSTHGAPGTVFIKDKTGAVNHPLYITGSGSSGSYAVTTLESVGSEGVVIDNASVEYTGAELIDADVELISGNFTTKGNVIFNQSLTVQSSSVTVSGDATFTQSVLVGNDAASAFITVGGQLTVPNNALVVDGITLSL